MARADENLAISEPFRVADAEWVKEVEEFSVAKGDQIHMKCLVRPFSGSPLLNQVFLLVK